jgi:hypothetical protein
MILIFLLAVLTSCAKAPPPETPKVKGDVFLVLTMHHLFAPEQSVQQFYRNILGEWHDTLALITKKYSGKNFTLNVSGPVVKEISRLELNDPELESVIAAEPEDLTREQADYLAEKYDTDSSGEGLVYAQILEALSWLGEELRSDPFIVRLTTTADYGRGQKSQLLDFMKEKIREFGALLGSVLDMDNIGEATTSLSCAYTDLLDEERVKVQILESMVNYKRWREKFPQGFVARGGFVNQDAIEELEKTNLEWVTAVSTGAKEYIRTDPQILFVDGSGGKSRAPGVVTTGIENMGFYLDNNSLNFLNFEGFLKEAFYLDEVPVKLSSSTFVPPSMVLDPVLEKMKGFLSDANEMVARYRNSGRASINALTQIRKKLLVAESGEFAADYASPLHDEIFRKTLIDIYRTVDITPPLELFIPVVDVRFYAAHEEMSSLVEVTCDGIPDNKEWDGAFRVRPSTPGIEEIYYGYDYENIYYMVKLSTGRIRRAGVYLGHLNAPTAALYTRGSENIPGFPLYIEFLLRRSVPEKTVIYRTAGSENWEALTGNFDVGFSTGILEFSVPMKYIGARPRKKIFQKFFVNNLIFPETYLGLTAPDFKSSEAVISFIDSTADARGPENYKYPDNMEEFISNLDFRKIEADEQYGEKVISIELSSVENPYSAPLGFSLSVIDIYIDVNRSPGLGNTSLLEERGGYVLPEDAWEYCVAINGWEKAVFNTAGTKIGEPEVSVSPLSKTINIFIPEDLIPAKVENWGMVPVLLAGDYKGKIFEIKPDTGENISEFRGRRLASDTNILDVILPPGFTQKKVLGANRNRGAIEIPALRRQ